MTLRTKLVLLYLSATILSIFIVSIFIFYWINYTGLQTIEKQLLEQSNSDCTYIKGELSLYNTTIDKLDTEYISEIMQHLSNSQGIINLYNQDRQVIGTSKYLSTELPEKDYSSLFNETKHSYIVKNNYLYFMSPIRINGKISGYYEIIYNLEFLNQITKNVLTTLAIGAVIFCLLLLIPITLLSRSVSIPINKMLLSTNLFANRIFTPININRKDEIGKLADSFNSMGIQLQNYITTQKDFVSNVSHELNTPLTAIKGYSEIVYEEAQNNENLKKAAYHLNNETIRLISLVNDLLALSRMDLNKEELIMKKVNLSIILNETIDKLRLKSKKYNISLIQNISKNTFVIADKKKIVQVFINLIDNSIKYSKKNGTVNIKLYKESGKAFIVIDDDGIGIPENEISLIFERFYRCDNAKNITGTGLGLALSKELIERHNGTIIMRNKKPSGTIVVISFPLQK